MLPLIYKLECQGIPMQHPTSYDCPDATHPPGGTPTCCQRYRTIAHFQYALSAKESSKTPKNCLARKKAYAWQQLLPVPVHSEGTPHQWVGAAGRRGAREGRKQLHWSRGGDAGAGEGAEAVLLELVCGGALGGVAGDEAQHSGPEDAQRPQQIPCRLRVFPWSHAVPQNYLDRLQVNTHLCLGPC
jgi:hypothetical protein